MVPDWDRALVRTVFNWVHYMSMVLSGCKNISTKPGCYNAMGFPEVKELKEKLTQI